MHRFLLFAAMLLVSWSAMAAGGQAQVEAARAAALAAEAPRLAAPAWNKAERQWQAAAEKTADGNSRAAERLVASALDLYTDAELLALKAALLTSARERVLAVREAGTRRAAPQTTTRAHELLEAAEASLEADRQDISAAEALASQAEDEADRALALAALLRPVGQKATGAEELALAWEAALQEAALAAGLGPLPPGPQAASGELVAALSTLRRDNEEQADELRQRALQISALEEELRELDVQLASTTDEARRLTERMEAERYAKAQYERLLAAFEPGEVMAEREDGLIRLRLMGLRFAPGGTRLLPASRALLDRLQAVVELYPAARFTVEGHTDASGNSADNQRLSQTRAEVLRDHMISKMQLSAGRVVAIGHGDLQPIASNATARGREQNRRLELLIETPALHH